MQSRRRQADEAERALRQLRGRLVDVGRKRERLQRLLAEAGEAASGEAADGGADAADGPAGAPAACELHDPKYTMRADPGAFKRLHKQAGLRYVEPAPEARRRGEPAQLHWFDRNGVDQGPSYQQQWHRVDAELRAHLDARHLRPPTGSSVIAAG